MGTMTTHADHKFSITMFSNDLAVVNCLRSLSKFSQKTGNNNIPWGVLKTKTGNGTVIKLPSISPVGNTARILCRWWDVFCHDLCGKR